ncbi:MAG: lysophospholipase [Proteobacteria bacterium]|nr:lysophospholipase [Pseudomonadota bacterium]
MTFFPKLTLILLVLIVIFGILPFTAMYFLQGKLIFPAPNFTVPAGPEGRFSQTVIETPDGERLRAWYAAPAAGQPSLMLFHGNADAAYFQVPRGEALAEAGFGVLLVEYRGYGDSTGEPTELGLITDGLASYDYLRGQTEGPIGILAHSIGTAVAIPVAAKRPIFALMLEAPMTSILDVARYRMGWLPLKMLMKYPFHSDQVIGQVTAPILIVHGTKDRVIPFELGKRLAALAPAGTEFIPIEGAGHNDLLRFGSNGLALDFFRQILDAN